MKEVRSILISSIITISVVTLALIYVFSTRSNSASTISDDSSNHSIVPVVQTDEANNSINASRRKYYN